MDVTYTSAIAEAIGKLEAGNPLPTLVPQKAWSSELTDALESASLDDLFEGESLKNTDVCEASKSGLLLWNDALDESHNISQELGNQTGSYWHGINASSGTGLQQLQVLFVRQSWDAPNFPSTS